MDYSKTWNLATIPESVFNRELSRRSYQRRLELGAAGGRPVVLRSCAKCGRKFPAAVLRKHQPCCGKASE